MSAINPYVPSIPFLGQAHCMHIKNKISIKKLDNNFKMKKYIRHPLNDKWTRPIYKNGQVH